jgi:hypothetical protein
MRTSLCCTEACDKFWVDSLLHLPNSPDFVPLDFHLFAPLETIMMVTGTAECHAPMLTKEGEQVLIGMNKCCASQVEEDSRQGWRLG